MAAFINVLLLIVNIIFFVISLLFGAFGVYEEIMGLAKAEKLLKKLHIPLSYNQVLIIGLICLTLTFITYILRAKLSGSM